MKRLFVLFTTSIMLISCDPVPEDTIQSFKQLGIKLEMSNINECMSEQLLAIQEDLDESINYDKLKEIVQQNNIKILRLSNNKAADFNCDVAIIDKAVNLQIVECDPYTIAEESKIEVLSQATAKMDESSITISTNSQQIIKTVIEYTISNVSDEERIALSRELIEETNNIKYISFEKLNNYSINFDIDRDKQSFIEDMACGAPLSFSEIIEQLTAKVEKK